MPAKQDIDKNEESGKPLENFLSVKPNDGNLKVSLDKLHRCRIGILPHKNIIKHCEYHSASKHDDCTQISMSFRCILESDKPFQFIVDGVTGVWRGKNTNTQTTSKNNTAPMLTKIP
jgi:hypothetical protein